MGLSARYRFAVGALAVLLPLTACTSTSPTAVTGTPTASIAHPRPAVIHPILDSVGPLFTDGLSKDHDCTASVVDSPGGNLLITAAHCLTGSGRGVQFAPAYNRGRTPFGVWTVTQAFVAAGWVTQQDPASDVAILRVADRDAGGRSQDIEQATGAATLGDAPADGSAIRAIAYNSGLDDQAITCATTVHYVAGAPSFDCHGFIGGSSGAPWLYHRSDGSWTVEGVIGGRNQGGCLEYTSYSPAFTAAVAAVLNRAVSGTQPSTLPAAASDGC